MRLKHFVGVEQAAKEVHSFEALLFEVNSQRTESGGREYKLYFKS